MSDITITKTAEDAASKAIRVSVPVDRVQAAELKAVREYGKRLRLPGFRNGKAPDAVVRKRFAPAIRQWVIEDIIRESWEQAKEAEKLQPISDPSVRNVKYEDGQPVEFEFLVEVRPDVSLDRIGGFTLSRKAQAVTDQMVTDQIEELRESRAAWVPLEGVKPNVGNMVRVEVTSLDETESKEPQSYSIVIGQGQALQSLEERIMELEQGQTAETDIRFPDDHPDSAKRGMARRVRITVQEVKRQELPPLDEAFASQVGDFNDLDSLRAAVRSDLETNAQREADAGVREQLLQQIIEANNIQAPASLVQRALHAYLHAYNIPHERQEQFYAEFRPVAVRHVQRELALTTLAEREKLFATEADIDQRVARIAESRNLSPRDVYASLEKGKRLPEIERGITEEKVFDFLMKQSTVEETD